MTPAARRRDEAARAAIAAAGDAPVVALSGGADSAVLAALAADASVGARAVHVHHHLRVEAHLDAERARALAHELGLAFDVVHVHADDIASAEGGLEAGARRARYAALGSVAEGAAVLTAHTASDRLETLLMRGATGAGLRALSGPRAAGHVYGVRVVRPLLAWWRQDIETFAARRGLVFANDASNADVRRARNRIRHEVLPALRPRGTEDAWDRSLAALATDADALAWFVAQALQSATTASSEGRLQLDRAALRALPDAALSAVVHGAARSVGGRPHAEFAAEVVRAVRSGGSAVAMAHRVRADIDRTSVIVAWCADPRAGR